MEFAMAAAIIFSSSELSRVGPLNSAWMTDVSSESGSYIGLLLLRGGRLMEAALALPLGFPFVVGAGERRRAGGERLRCDGDRDAFLPLEAPPPLARALLALNSSSSRRRSSFSHLSIFRRS